MLTYECLMILPSKEWQQSCPISSFVLLLTPRPCYVNSEQLGGGGRGEVKDKNICSRKECDFFLNGEKKEMWKKKGRRREKTRAYVEFRGKFVGKRMEKEKGGS